MNFDKDEVKNSLTLDQVAELFMDLGGSPPIIKSGILMGETICHNLPGEANGHKLWYYDNTKLWRCYTECHEAFDIFQLVQKAKMVQYNEDWSLPRCVAYVANMFGIQGTMDGFEGEHIEDWKMINHYEALEQKIKKIQEKQEMEISYYDDTILSRFYDLYPESWIREGISIDTMKKYQIKYYPTSAKIVIPHWDIDSKLIGIRGRSLIKAEAELYGKYMPLMMANGDMYNHPLSFALYGLNFNKENIRKAKKAIIFEGEKSVMLFETYYGAENNIAVASCGSTISTYQFELLMELGVEEIIIAFDRQFQEPGDKEFLQHVKTVSSLAKKFTAFVTVSAIFDIAKLTHYKDSPIDRGKAIFEKLFIERKYYR